MAVPSLGNRACCMKTKGCNLRTDCTCYARMIQCRDPSLGKLNVGKRGHETLDAVLNVDDEESRQARRRLARRSKEENILDLLV